MTARRDEHLVNGTSVITEERKAIMIEPIKPATVPSVDDVVPPSDWIREQLWVDAYLLGCKLSADGSKKNALEFADGAVDCFDRRFRNNTSAFHDDLPLLEDHEVAELLNIPKSSSIQTLSKKGELPCVMIGSKRRWLRQDVANYAKSRRES